MFCQLFLYINFLAIPKFFIIIVSFSCQKKNTYQFANITLIKSIHLKSILCFNFCSMCFSFFVFDISTFCMICQHFIFFRPRELPAIQSKLFRHFVRTTRNKKSQKQTKEFYYSKYSHDSQKNKCQPRLTTVLEDNLYKEH